VGKTTAVGKAGVVGITIAGVVGITIAGIVGITMVGTGGRVGVGDVEPGSTAQAIDTRRNKPIGYKNVRFMILSFY